jgi:hypothetical protein
LPPFLLFLKTATGSAPTTRYSLFGCSFFFAVEDAPFGGVLSFVSTPIAAQVSLPTAFWRGAAIVRFRNFAAFPLSLWPFGYARLLPCRAAAVDQLRQQRRAFSQSCTVAWRLD